MIDLKLTEHQKMILSNIGSGGYGREFIEILEKIKTRLCSIEDLPSGGDHNAEVEGRVLFANFANALIEQLNVERRRRPQDETLREGRADYS